MAEQYPILSGIFMLVGALALWTFAVRASERLKGFGFNQLNSPDGFWASAQMWWCGIGSLAATAMGLSLIINGY